MDITRIGDRMMACFRMEDLHPREQIILAILAWHDGAGGAWPSYKGIADAAGIARSTAIGVVKSLQEKGRIRVVRGRHTNTYEIAYLRPFPQGHCQEHPTPVSVRENQSVRNNGKNGSLSGTPDHTVSGTPDPNLKAADKGKIGWCRDCGHDHSGGPACLVCGGASAPFIVAPHECREGALTMPLGIVVSGLTTPEARRVFLGDEGQEQLRTAFEHVLESQPLH